MPQIRYTLFLIIISQLSLSAVNIQSESPFNREEFSNDTLVNDFSLHTFDTIRHISLSPVEIVRPYQFTNNRQKKKYYQLESDIIKTYPLALIVLDELNFVNAELDRTHKEKSDKKKYLKNFQHYVYQTYIDSLTTLNIRQGRLLLKLIHRETGMTPYELIRTYRGGLNALFWQSAALLLGANLNSYYDPLDDAMIEYIVRKYKRGELEKISSEE